MPKNRPCELRPKRRMCAVAPRKTPRTPGRANDGETDAAGDEERELKEGEWEVDDGFVVNKNRMIGGEPV